MSLQRLPVRSKGSQPRVPELGREIHATADCNNHGIVAKWPGDCWNPRGSPQRAHAHTHTYRVLLPSSSAGEPDTWGGTQGSFLPDGVFTVVTVPVLGPPVAGLTGSHIWVSISTLFALPWGFWDPNPSNVQVHPSCFQLLFQTNGLSWLRHQALRDLFARF